MEYDISAHGGALGNASRDGGNSENGYHLVLENVHHPRLMLVNKMALFIESL